MQTCNQSDRVQGKNNNLLGRGTQIESCGRQKHSVKCDVSAGDRKGCKHRRVPRGREKLSSVPERRRERLFTGTSSLVQQQDLGVGLKQRKVRVCIECNMTSGSDVGDSRLGPTRSVTFRSF